MQLPSNHLTQRGPIILGIDVGTTNIKCYAYDHNTSILGKASEKINLLSTEDGGFEIAPDDLWENFLKVVSNCLISSHAHASEVTCMGISTQRGTFLTWDSETSEPFHNFITWKDQRADDLCAKWNASLLVKLLRWVCLVCFVVTRRTWFQIASAVHFSSAMVLTRLYWILERFPEIRLRSQQQRSKRVLFGTLDTWLVWKLTGGRVHATDRSNACVTGFYDPIQMIWVDWMLKYFDIPENILPCIKDTSDSFGETLPDIFGSAIPISCLVGDQQASAFGACCLKENDVNCTMGTGSFLTINTGSEPSVSRHAVVPLIGWTIRSQTTYLSECRMHDAGTFVSWLQNLGFLSNPAEASDVARSVPDSGGVYFLPAHSSSKKPAPPRLVGLRCDTSKEQIVRSVLESLAFQVCLLFEAACRLGGGQNIQVIRICGGVSQSDFVAQLVSDVTGLSVHRWKHGETSSLGAAFLAGLHAGVWKRTEDLVKIQRDYDVFTPAVLSRNTDVETFQNWKKNLERATP